MIQRRSNTIVKSARAQLSKKPNIAKAATDVSIISITTVDGLIIALVTLTIGIVQSALTNRLFIKMTITCFLYCIVTCCIFSYSLVSVARGKKPKLIWDKDGVHTWITYSLLAAIIISSSTFAYLTLRLLIFHKWLASNNLSTFQYISANREKNKIAPKNEELGDKDEKQKHPEKENLKKKRAIVDKDTESANKIGIRPSSSSSSSKKVIEVISLGDRRGKWSSII